MAAKKNDAAMKGAAFELGKAFDDANAAMMKAGRAAMKANKKPAAKKPAKK